MATLKAARKPAPTKPAPVKGAGLGASKRKTDWEAVERDYRTGKFTLRELEEKHGVNNSTILRKAKKEGWSQDLTLAIKQATNAKLIEAIVAEECSKTQQNAADTVLAAADINTRVILSHRTRLASLNDAVEAAKSKLLQLGDSVADIREAATFVQAVGNLATATKTLIEQERRNHGLDDAQGSDDKADRAVRVTFV